VAVAVSLLAINGRASDHWPKASLAIATHPNREQVITLAPIERRGRIVVFDISVMPPGFLRAAALTNHRQRRSVDPARLRSSLPQRVALPIPASWRRARGFRYETVRLRLVLVPASATPAPSTGTPQVSWAPPGSLPLWDSQAAALVTSEPETQPGNVQANAYVPSDSDLAAFQSATERGRTPVQDNPLDRYVTGRPGILNPSTDDLIQWVAHKWGIPEDWLRAVMLDESKWRQSGVGDRATVSRSLYRLYPPAAQISGTSDVYQSLGIAQVKWNPPGSGMASWEGTEPLRWKSTAFNLDFYAAQVRYYYDGDCGWCGPHYSAGQAWQSIGAWFQPSPWNNADARSYVRRVQQALATNTAQNPPT
jgi:hypothetical protein